MTLNASTRAWIYGVAVALIPILVSFGLLTEDRAPLFVALVAALLSAAPPALALRNVTPDPPKAQPDDDDDDAADLPDGGLTDTVALDD